MLLDRKHGLVLGVANKRSLAWGIAQVAHREGARLAVTYQGERLEKNVRQLAEGLRDPLLLPCDVSRDEDLKEVARRVDQEFGGLDFVVHAVAFALREELDGEFLATTVSTVGTQTASAGDAAEAAEAFLSALRAEREAYSGVNLDEEAVNLVLYERTFQAAARLVATVDDLIRMLLEL